MAGNECSWPVSENAESAWTREKEKSKPSKSAESSKSMKVISLREKNKRLRAIYEDEALEYGEEDVTEKELVDRFRVATSLREKRLEQVFKLIRQASFVQLCFVIDATGSMGPHIDGVKKFIKSIVDNLLHHKTNGEAVVKELQLGMIAYRDYGDSKQFEELQFTKSLEVFNAFCLGIKPFGGGYDGGGCEDVLGGFDRALKLNWDPEVGAKLICHMGDRPGHGRELHDQHNRSYDYFLAGDPNGLQYTDLFQQLREKGIEYHFGKITDHTDIMIEKFSKVYGEAVHVLNVQDVNKILEFVVSSVQLSVSSAVSKSTMIAARKRSIRSYTLILDEPDWFRYPVDRGTFISYSFPESIQDIVDDIPLGKRVPKSAKVKIAQNPFAKGSERLAFYGLDQSTYVKHPTKGAKSQKKESVELKTKNDKIVLKEYLHVGRGMNTAKRYELTNQMQTIASYLASEFTKELKYKTGIDKEIKFLKIRTLRVASERGERFMSCERRYKSGDLFVRFTNNTNYTILESKAQKLGIPLVSIDILMTFSHWTYQVSGAKLMVVDLQGIVTTDEKGQKKVILTDPAIHCVDNTRFGPMNHGAGGMRNFFKRHICNSFCKSLGLVMPVLPDEESMVRFLGLPPPPTHTPKFNFGSAF
ncbi:unnamed protein product [Auanema sp. JU1783]|nr:unnamed protein product [Auanema sp. JU1783]